MKKGDIDNEDYSTDDGKRRGEWEDNEVFKRSKKINRTPDRGTKEKGKEDMSEIKNMMKIMMQGIQELKEGQKKYEDEIRSLKRENEEMKTKFKELNLRLDNMEKGKIRNNLVISGLKLDAEGGENLKEEINNFIREKLGIEVKLKGVRKIGTDKGIVEVENFDDKSKILKHKYKLKTLNQHIYVDSELTKTDRVTQAKIRNEAKELRASGKQVKVAYRKAIIEGEVWKWNEEQQCLEKTAQVLRPSSSKAKN